MSLSPKAKDRVRLLIVAIGVAVLAIVFVVSTAVIAPGLYRKEVAWKWIRFAIVTVVFVGYCLKTYWRVHKRLGFWLILIGILILHFLGVGYFYYAGAGLPLLVFGPIVALEWALLAVVIYHFLDVGPSVRNH